jgi:hypothetical protein
MKKRVYIETSIPSFYYETRVEPEMVAMRNWTRDWWDNHSSHYELVTSEAVFEELNEGKYSTKEEAVTLIEDFPTLEVDKAVIEIVNAYVTHKAMPRNPKGDALHLALATHHKCDFLLTWNCNHLANPNKFIHLSAVNALLGYVTPQLTTPFAMLGG